MHAVELLADVLIGAADPVTVVAVGPLTNVGLLLRRHPEAAAASGRSS
jgi:purine nucleosidase/pyrimidine-specific ribonucleoside hydrolase